MMRNTSSGFSEADWEMLLAFIQERGVIPVTGEAVSEIIDPADGKKRLFREWLARELSTRLGVPGDTLETIISGVLSRGGNLRSLYPQIRNIVLSAPFEPPPALAKLASIREFPFHVTTTFDGLLAKAIAKAVPSHTAQELSYSPKQFDDLPPGFATQPEPIVYHLLGKAAAIARYTICDEDVLEWISALQSETYSPERLVSELQNHHLLVIGVNYPDWLGRFFVRTAKRRRLSEDREWFEFLVHPEASSDKSLAQFLRSVSRNTFVIGNCSTPSEFVDELHERWTAGGSAPQPSVTPSTNGLSRFLPPSREMPPDSIFISYSRTDLDSVKALKSSFDSLGMPVWFDLEQLAVGDDYHDRIRRNIYGCSYFIPVISSAALARDEAFFYREWAWAADRRLGMGPGALFILPIIVDDTPLGHPRIAEFARSCDIARLPGGVPDEKFLKRLSELPRLAHV